MGVDFRGGIAVEVYLPHVKDVNTLRGQLKTALEKDIALQTLGASGDIFLIRAESTPDDAVFLQKMKHVLGKDAQYRKIESIGPKVSEDLIRNGLWAVFWAILAIMAYVCFRFQWQFSICAGIALFHDCLCVLGFYSLFGYEVSENIIVATLITASYSVNDTVIIFDRIRENLKKNLGVPFIDIVQRSIGETLSRTIFTSLSTLVALLMLCFFGGEVIRAFSLPIFVGIFFGTISSISLSAPLLYWFPSRWTV